jgi:DNA-binding response OmpR family regulator
LRPSLDIDLGDVSGIELTHRLKANGNSVPVIYMTGNDSPVVRTAAHQSGCLAYLTKPFSARSLIEPLEEGLGCLTLPKPLIAAFLLAGRHV